MRSRGRWRLHRSSIRGQALGQSCSGCGAEASHSAGQGSAAEIGKSLRKWQKYRLSVQVREYEAQLRQLEAAVQQQQRAGKEGGRAELLGQRAEGAAAGSSASHRDRLLQSTQKLDMSGERIHQSRQMVADMEVKFRMQQRHADCRLQHLCVLHGTWQSKA